MNHTKKDMINTKLKDVFINKNNKHIEDIFDILEENKKKKIEEGENVDDLVDRIEQLKKTIKTINLKVLSQIKTNLIYKKLIFSEKYNSDNESIKNLIIDAENYMNRKIKEAVKHPTKLKREKEKNIVINFLVKNKYNIKNILYFCEKLEEIKC